MVISVPCQTTTTVTNDLLPLAQPYNDFFFVLNIEQLIHKPHVFQS
jgi:hypothetical protein